jgi:alpha/beta superfamily hydrolase
MEEFWKTGRAPDDPHRRDDAAAAFDWLRALTDRPIVPVGYSFGASLLGGLLDGQTRGVVLIGATFAQHEYGELASCGVPKLLIAADNDFATPLSITQQWFAAASEPKRLVVVPAAEHFYRGQEDRIVEEIMAWLPA